MEAISSSDSMDNELTKKSLSTLLLFIDIEYQCNKNDTIIPKNPIFQSKSSITNGIKIKFSEYDSNSTTNLKLETTGKTKSTKALFIKN
jgi:hypothetical protein